MANKLEPLSPGGVERASCYSGAQLAVVPQPQLAVRVGLQGGAHAGGEARKAQHPCCSACSAGLHSSHSLLLSAWCSVEYLLAWPYPLLALRTLTLPYQSMRGTLVAPNTVTSSIPAGFSKDWPMVPVTMS